MSDGATQQVQWDETPQVQWDTNPAAEEGKRLNDQYFARTQNKPGVLGSLAQRAMQFIDPNNLKSMAVSAGRRALFGGLDPVGDIDRARSLIGADKTRQEQGRSLPYRVLAALGQSTGVADPTAMEKSAEIGDTGGVLGNAAADAAPVLIAEGAGRGLPALSRKIGASEALESVPNRTVGDVLENPSKLPAYLLRKAAPKPFDMPTRGNGAGAPLPTSDEFYANKAKDLEARGNQQRILDRREATAQRANVPRGTSEPFAGATSTAPSQEEAIFQRIFGPEYKEAGDLAQWETGNREGGPVTGGWNTLPKVGAAAGTMPPVKFVSKFEAPAKSSIVSPESPAPHVEGSYWSFKEPALRKAVMGGDREAATVYVQRFGELPPGAGLLTDIGSRALRGLYKSKK